MKAGVAHNPRLYRVEWQWNVCDDVFDREIKVLVVVLFVLCGLLQGKEQMLAVDFRITLTLKVLATTIDALGHF